MFSVDDLAVSSGVLDMVGVGDVEGEYVGIEATI